VLSEISADDVPEFIVFNKSDIARDVADDLLADYRGSVAVSAVTGEGIDHMLVTLGDRLRSLDTVVELLVPWDRGDVIASIHREGQVVSTVEGEHGMTIRARLSDASAGRLDEWLVSKSPEAASNTASEAAVRQDESMRSSRRCDEGSDDH
jgi:GTP-binding protein HflX